MKSELLKIVRTQESGLSVLSRGLSDFVIRLSVGGCDPRDDHIVVE
jgi:hypothetical protein